MIDKTLSHHGVMGMHWGRKGGPSPSGIGSKRRDQTPTGIGSTHKDAKPTGIGGIRKDHAPTSIGSTHQDHKKAHDLKHKRLSDMSNEDIRTLTTRMELERKFHEARKQDHSSGKKFVMDALANAGKQVAVTFIAKGMVKGVDQLINILHHPKK